MSGNCTAPVTGHTKANAEADCPMHGARRSQSARQGGAQRPQSILDLGAGDKVFVLKSAAGVGRPVKKASVLRRTATMIVLDDGSRFSASSGVELGRDHGAVLTVIDDEAARAEYRTMLRDVALSNASIGLSNAAGRSKGKAQYTPEHLAEIAKGLARVKRALLLDATSREDSLTPRQATPSGAPHAYTDDDVVAVLGPVTRTWFVLDERLEEAGVPATLRDSIGVFAPAYTRSQFVNLLTAVDLLADSRDVPGVAVEAAETAQKALLAILGRMQGYEVA